MRHTALHKDTIIACAQRKYFYSAGDFKKARELLKGYFRGEKVSFNMRLNLKALSPFTRKVLQKIRVIPYGETRSYAEVAREVGIYKGSRAIGQAMKRNPLPVIMPCHRVIKANGEIGGFSMGSVVKKKLVEMENHVWKNSR